MTNIERYDYAFDPEGDAWAARVMRRLPPHGSVLELGPGPGAMTRVLLARGYRVVVVENDPEALDVLRSLDVEVVAGDLEQSDWQKGLAGRRFDAILACDVLEHLRAPEAVLQSLGDLLEPTGRLIISVPNIAYAGVVAALRNGIFDYADKGQLDRTHVRFFTKRSAEKMLLDCGWTPRSWEANRVPLENSEFAWCWNALTEAQRQALQADWLDFDAYQWMVIATPASDALIWETSQMDKLRSEFQALTLLHRQEHASLLEHQKAFSEAKDAIQQLQSAVQALRTEKTAVEAELQTQRAKYQQMLQKPWYLRWRRIS